VIMNIYDFAINFEIENRKLYEEFAAKSGNEHLRGVFLRLAEAEKKHENIVRQLKEQKKVDEVETDILSSAKEAFESISKDLEGQENKAFPQKQVDVYKKAKEMVNRPNTWLDDAEWNHLEEY